MSQSRQVHLNDLPKDILLRILRYIPVKHCFLVSRDFYKLSRIVCNSGISLTNETLHQLVDEYLLLNYEIKIKWLRLEELTLDSHNLEKLSLLFPFVKETLNELSLSGCRISSTNFGILLSFASNIKCLKVDSVNFFTQEAKIMKLDEIKLIHLRSLVLRYNGLDVDDYVTKILSPNTLRELDYDNNLSVWSFDLLKEQQNITNLSFTSKIRLTSLNTLKLTKLLIKSPPVTLEWALRNQDNLEELHWFGGALEVEDIARIGQLSKLRILEISAPFKQHSEEIFNKLVASKKLEHLIISQFHELKWMHLWNENVSRLEIMTETIPPSTIANIAKCMPNLKLMDITFTTTSYRASYDVFYILVKNCPTLEVLSLKTMTAEIPRIYNRSYLNDMHVTNSRLKSLYISSATDYAEGVLQKMADDFPNIEKLSIRSSSGFIDSEVIAIFEHFTQLQELELWGCVSISLEIINFMVNQLQNIKVELFELVLDLDEVKSLLAFVPRKRITEEYENELLICSGIWMHV